MSDIYKEKIVAFIRTDNDITMLYVIPEYQGANIGIELIKYIDNENLNVNTCIKFLFIKLVLY